MIDSKSIKRENGGFRAGENMKNGIGYKMIKKKTKI